MVSKPRNSYTEVEENRNINKCNAAWNIYLRERERKYVDVLERIKLMSKMRIVVYLLDLASLE